MRLVTLMLLASVVATPAFAQTLSPMTGTTAAPPTATTPTTTAPARAHRMTMQQRFDAANTTHDGKLTLDQAKAAKMTRIVANFDAIDTGKKGYVTTDDIRVYNRAQRAAHRAAKPAAQ
jgi:hypothetical protein